MNSKQDIVKPRTPEDVVRSYGLKHKQKNYAEPGIYVGNTYVTEKQMKQLLELLKK